MIINRCLRFKRSAEIFIVLLTQASVALAAPPAQSRPWCWQDRASQNFLEHKIPELRCFESALDHFPAGSGQKRGLKTWQNILGLDQYGGADLIGGRLLGLTAYFAPLLANDLCLQQALIAFYQRLSERQNALARSLGNTWAEFSFDESAGRGRYASLKPGWLWEDLISASGGNAQLALRILGVLNSDPRALASLGLELIADKKEREDYFKAQKLAQEKVRVLNMKRQGLDSRDENFQKASDEIDSIQAELARKLTDIKSRTRIVFNFDLIWLPGSLGPGWDIPDDFKNRLRTSYRADTQNLPGSKSYHIFVAASTVCEAISAGLSRFIAVPLQRMAGWSYRAARLNLDIEELQEKKKAGAKLTLEENTDLDAALLASQNFLSSGAMGRSQLISDIPITFSNSLRLLPINEFYDPQGPQSREEIMANMSPPQAWSPQRFNLAKTRLQRWIDDWHWTVLQHSLGAQFAASVCQKKPSPDAPVCQVQ